MKARTPPSESTNFRAPLPSESTNCSARFLVKARTHWGFAVDNSAAPRRMPRLPPSKWWEGSRTRRCASCRVLVVVASTPPHSARCTAPKPLPSAPLTFGHGQRSGQPRAGKCSGTRPRSPRPPVAHLTRPIFGLAGLTRGEGPLPKKLLGSTTRRGGDQWQEDDQISSRIR